MLRNISHELKTPLATIREGIELLRDGVPGALNREQSDIVEIVRNDSLKLQKLIENVISLNVAQGEELSVTWQPVELRGLLDNVLEEHRLLMEGRGVRVDRTLDQARVSGDRDKLKTVFENVISNAVKYSPDGGEIAVGLRRNAGHAHVDVIDHGPGVDPAERQKVFELFYRGRARAASQVKGSGVGLAIAQAYVQLHNGTIEFVDCPRGAHVRVVLPLAGE
jgi:two-component system sensor histidine kinase GlrK